MKKFIFAALLALPLAFISCSKDDDDKAPDSIANTSWSYTETEEDEDGTTSISVMTYTFTTDSVKLVMNASYGGFSMDIDLYSSTYSYKKPTVTLYNYLGADGVTATGTVKDNQLIFTGSDNTSLIFTKK